jgi:hypothetical protein
MPPTPPSAPEDELLLTLVHGGHSPGGDVRLRALLGASPDWTVLSRHAQVHEVLPLVAHHLERLALPEVPSTVTAEFRRLASVYRAGNLLLASELRQALQHLRTAGVSVIPLKGIALASALYGDATLRVCRDLDLLVQQPRLADAVGVLEVNGYRAQGPWQRWAAAAYHVEIPLTPRTAERRFDVDLHWGLLGGDPRYRDAAEECWSAARPATVLGVETWAMSPEWELLFLALRAARSQWQGLKWLVDIRQMLWTWPLDWPSIWTLARRWGWQQILELTLTACGHLWQLPPLPGAGGVSWPRWLARFPDPPRQTRWAGLRVVSLLLPRWKSRLGYVLRLIGTPTPNDYRWLPLPARLSFLYFFVRPVRWVVMTGKWCLGAALRRTDDRLIARRERS